MTNHKKKSDKPLNQEQLNKLWDGALEELRFKATRAEELMKEGYRPFAEVFKTMGIPSGNRAGVLGSLKKDGWSCEKARWNGAVHNFVRPPLE